MKYILWIAVIAIALLGWMITNGINTNNTPSSNIFVGADIGGPFTLNDHTGKTVTEKDFSDRYKFIYFGFTFCPAICPTELQKMTLAYNDLPQDLRDKLAFIFISVDPERDTVPVMKDYISLFHPDLIGLTGTVEQVNAIKNAYRVYAAKVQDETMSDYTVDHSSYIYLMSPNNELVDLYKISSTKDEIVESIKRNLKN